MAFTPELLDQLLERAPGSDDLLGPGGLFDQLKKALAERALGAELQQHLTTEAAQPAPPRNHRNGTTPKTVQTDTSALRLAVEVSPTLISTVTDAVLDELTTWQQRPLAAVYPVIFFDALRVKIRDEGTVRNKAVYLALGVLPDGRKDVLGIWIEQTEGAKFWVRVMTELQARGVQDVLVAVVDGLKASPRRSPVSSPRPRSRPASSTCCATPCTS